jgi:hypothetical protein
VLEIVCSGRAVVELLGIDVWLCVVVVSVELGSIVKAARAQSPTWLPVTLIA